MARSFTRVNSQWLSLALTNPTYPYSVGCWFRDTSIATTGKCLLQVSDRSASNKYSRLHQGAEGAYIEGHNRWVSGPINTWPSTYSEDDWHYAVATFVSQTSQFVSIDGGTFQEETASSTSDPTGVDQLGIGAENDATTDVDHWEGDIAE